MASSLAHWGICCNCGNHDPQSVKNGNKFCRNCGQNKFTGKNIRNLGFGVTTAIDKSGS